jgi:hypothetical protein
LRHQSTLEAVRYQSALGGKIPLEGSRKNILSALELFIGIVVFRTETLKEVQSLEKDKSWSHKYQGGLAGKTS